VTLSEDESKKRLESIWPELESPDQKTEQEIQDFVASKLSDILTEEHSVNVSLYRRKVNEAKSSFELLQITASISHPEFASFGVYVTFRI